jgi:hypothetical protein
MYVVAGSGLMRVLHTQRLPNIDIHPTKARFPRRRIPVKFNLRSVINPAAPMQLYLDSYGAFLAARNGMFAVRTKSGGEQAFAVRDVQAILCTKSTALSTDAALLAASNDIPILIIDANTHYPLAQVSSGRPGFYCGDPEKPGRICPRGGGFYLGRGAAGRKNFGVSAPCWRNSPKIRARLPVSTPTCV